MRFDTGPVCMTLQTEPKTTPRPMPREASRIKERRTQLAPAVARGSKACVAVVFWAARRVGASAGGARGAAMACYASDRRDFCVVVFGERFCVCGLCAVAGAAN